jgi:hypothetical protein
LKKNNIFLIIYLILLIINLINMEEALIILKEIQNKLINRNNNDDQK